MDKQNLETIRLVIESIRKDRDSFDEFRKKMCGEVPGSDVNVNFKCWWKAVTECLNLYFLQTMSIRTGDFMLRQWINQKALYLCSLCNNFYQSFSNMKTTFLREIVFEYFFF